MKRNLTSLVFAGALTTALAIHEPKKIYSQVEHYEKPVAREVANANYGPNVIFIKNFPSTSKPYHEEIMHDDQNRCQDFPVLLIYETKKIENDKIPHPFRLINY